METKANYVAVGAFVLACMVGLVVTVLWLAGTQNISYSFYTVRFHGSVTGLGKGTVVRYNGLEAGRVEDLVLDPKDPKTVLATIKVDQNYDIHSDAVASIASQGLTGGSYVLITGGSIDKPVLRHVSYADLEEDPVIQSVPGTFERLENKLDVLADKISVVADRVNLVLDDKNRAAIADILKNIDALSATLSRNSANIDATLRNTKDATANLATASRDLHPALVQANAALQHIDKLANDADNVVNKAGDSIEDVPALLADARRLVNSLNKLSDELNREPTRVIFGDRRKGYTPK